MSAPLVSTDTPGVYKRGSRYVATWRDPSGKQRSKSARNVTEAKQIRASMQADVQRGEYQPKSRVRFDDYAAEWIVTYQGQRRRGLRETTRRVYRSNLERHAIPFFGRTALSDIDTPLVQSFLQHVFDKPGELGNEALGNAIKPLRALFSSAVKEGLIRHNPVREAELPYRDVDQEDDDEQGKALSREQLAAFLAIVHPRMRLLFETLAGTGLRNSELFGLQWQHLELDVPRPQVRVRRALVNGFVHKPKSKYARRDITITRDLARKLRAHHAATEWPRPEDPVFVRPDGTPLREGTIRRRYLNPVMEEIGASGMGYHSFRHSAASMLFERGANPVQVQRFLGHHSPAFTMSTYVHLLSKDDAPTLDLAVELDGVTAAEQPDLAALHSS